MSRAPYRYVCRCIGGLEELIGAVLAASFGCDIWKREHRTIFFDSTLQPEALCEITMVDDVFILIGQLQGIDHTRESLGKIAGQLRDFAPAAAVDLCREIRPIAERKGVSVTASFVGKRNYSRWDLAEVVESSFRTQIPYPFLDPKSGALPEHDLHLRIHLEGTMGWIGARLSRNPLAKRVYKKNHLQGSLAPQLASYMLLLARPNPGDTVLDPMCGVGTIPCEVAFQKKDVRSIGVDLSCEALAAAAENSSGFSSVLFMQASAFALPLQTAAVDRIVSDLPWGEQTLVAGTPVGSCDMAGAYELLLKEFARVVKPGGRVVLLSECAAELETAVAATPFVTEQRIPVSLFGKHPELFVLNSSKR